MKKIIYTAQFSRIFKLFIVKLDDRRGTFVGSEMLEKVAHPVRIRSLPAERSLRSSGCLQTLITSANGGPFLNRHDANIYRRVPTPYSWTPASSRSTPTSTIPPRSFWTSFPRRLSRQIYSSSTVENPMETYLSGCPDDAKSNFVSRGRAAT